MKHSSLFKKLALFSTLTLGFSTVAPLSENTAAALSSLSGLGGGAAAYALAHSSKANPIMQVLVTTFGVAGAGLLGHLLFSRFTPQGRYNRALSVVKSAEMEALLACRFQSYEELKSTCKSNFENDWYLVSGKMKLLGLKSNLLWAWSMLECVQQEAYAQHGLIAQCEKTRATIQKLLGYNKLALDLIDCDTVEYHHQRKHYDAYLERIQRQDIHTTNRFDRWADSNQRERHHRETMNVLR